MTIIEPFWVTAWFLAGLITFQFTEAKKILTTISFIFTIISFLSFNSIQLQSILNFLGINYLGGILTGIVYLIGANISRYLQFGVISPRIIIYIVIFIFLLIIFL